MLTPVPDEAAADWITNSLSPQACDQGDESTGVCVSHCLPQTFGAYAKVFHPIYLDESVAMSGSSWATADDRPSTIGRPASVDPGPDATGPRVSWQSLATQLGLTFHSELNEQSLKQAFPDQSFPRHLLGPAEGTLDRRLCQALVRRLSGHTNGERCFFHYTMIATMNHEAITCHGQLEDVLESFELENVWGSPSYWWPESRNWCVCTDWDLTFSFAGGSKDLVRSVIEDAPEVEAVPVLPSTRVDWRSDRINQTQTGKR